MERTWRWVTVVAVVLAISVVPSGVGGYPGDTDPASNASDLGPIGATEVTTITDCRTITRSGYYRLTSDLVDRTEDLCIRIFASDVIFDGDGHRIDGIGRYLYTPDGGTETSTKGILVKQGPHTNVTVRDVVVTDFGYGVWYQGTSDGRIVDSTFRDNGIYGVYLGYDAHDNIVTRNLVVNTTSPGLDVAGQGIVVANIANRNEIRDNEVRRSERHGIAVHLGDQTQILDNTVVDSGRNGITGVGEGTEIADNVVERSGEVGINYARANGTRITGNRIRESPQGITFGFSRDATISGNAVDAVEHVGILIHGDIGTTRLIDNTIGTDPVWDIHVRRHVAPVDVEGYDLGGPATAAFTARRVSVVGDAIAPDALHAGQRQFGGVLKVAPKRDTAAWMDLSVVVDTARLDPGTRIDLLVYRGNWRQLDSASAGGDRVTLATNLTSLEGPAYLAVATSGAATPDSDDPAGDSATAEPTGTAPKSPGDGDGDGGTTGRSPTEGGGSGFGLLGTVSALVLLVTGIGLATRRSRSG